MSTSSTTDTLAPVTPLHPAPTRTAEEERQHARRWRILAILGIAQLMVVLDATIVNIALPDAQRALGFSNGDRQWIVTAYSLAFGGLLLLGGRLSDFLGRKRMLLIGLVGFAGASALGGAATGFGLLVAARGLQGAFGAVLAPAALSLLTTTFRDPAERGKAFAIYGALAGAGGAVGLLLGGVLTEYLSWRWCLYVNVAFAVVAFAGASAWLRDLAAPATAHLDLPGTLTVVAGLVGIVYGFSEAETRGWSDPLTLGLIGGGLVLIGVFVAIERRVAHPLLPLRVVLDRARGASYLAVGIVGIGLFGVFLFFTFYLQQSQGYSPVKTGIAFLPLIAGIAVGAQVGGQVLLARIGPRLPVSGGLLAGAAGLLLATRIDVGSSYVTVVLPAIVIFGLGVGFVFGAALNVATAGAAPEDAGVASAMVSTAQQVSGAIGTALLNTLASSAVASYAVDHAGGRPPTQSVLARAAVHGDIRAFVVAGAVLAVGAVVCFLIYRPGTVETSGEAVHLG